MEDRMLSVKNKINVLVLGAGSREHALVWKISQSKILGNLYAAPGNAGMADRSRSIDINDFDAINVFCEQQSIDLVVIGSEELLSAGLSDALEMNNIGVFGPSQRAALIESDKAYTRKICLETGIPSPHYQIFDTLDGVMEYINTCATTIVIKDSFLAMGKGVLVSDDRERCAQFARDIFSKGRKGQTIVIEEYLVGPEVSAFVMCDGTNLQFLGDAQDYKRIHDGDLGDNTGGMGAVSPAPSINDVTRSLIVQEFARPMVEYLKKQGVVYKGIIFLGLMITKNGPKLLEFNARFGDPETQALMPRIDCDILELLLSVTRGTLNECTIKLSKMSSVCVVMATQGYPGNYKKGSIIRIPPTNGALIFHSNTAMGPSGALMAMGGRTLSIVSTGATTAEAAKQAYDAICGIEWQQGYYRKDIGR